MNKANVYVESKTLTEGELENIRNEVESWKEKGYQQMAIFYFLGQRYSVSGTYDESDKFVITLS